MDKKYFLENEEEMKDKDIMKKGNNKLTSPRHYKHKAKKNIKVENSYKEAATTLIKLRKTTKLTRSTPIIDLDT